MEQNVEQVAEQVTKEAVEVAREFPTVQLLTSVVIAVLTILLIILVQKISNRFAKQKRFSGEKSTIFRVISGIFRTFLILVAILLILQINGVNVTSLIAGLGIASAIVGLALQDFLKDVIMGVHIMTDHFYSVGECVELNGQETQIIAFTLKTTTAMSLDDHSIITLCNRNVEMIRRLSDRMDLDVPLSYGEDRTHVDAVLRTVAERIGELQSVSKCDYLGTQNFNDSSIFYRLRIHCDPQKRPDVRRAALLQVRLGLEAENIQIPFNQLDVHMFSDEKQS